MVNGIKAEMASKVVWMAVCLLLTGCVAAQDVFDLGEKDWKLVNRNGTIALSKVRVPSHVLEILRAEGIIEDPLYRFGETDTRWVAMETWTYSTTFSGAEVAALVKRDTVVLHLGGVDTKASVLLNGKDIAQVNNYYRTFDVPVKDLLSKGTNTLTVVISPAIPYVLEEKANHPYYIPTVTQLGNVDAYNFQRKPAYDFGWDWGPGFAASGIHGVVQLLAYDRAILKGAHVHQSSPTTESFSLHVEAELRAPSTGDIGLLKVEMPQLGVSSSREVTLRPHSISWLGLDFEVDASKVDLWWPINMGKQPLYELVVTFTPRGEDALPRKAAITKEAAAASQTTVKRRVGFRTVVLHRDPVPKAAADLLSKAGGWENDIPIQNRTVSCGGSGNCGQWGWLNATKWSFVSAPLTPNGKIYSGYPFPPHPSGEQPWWGDALGVYMGTSGDPSYHKYIEGESFYYSVNGVPVYAKGANIIPFNVLSTNVTDELIKKTMDLAIASKMNMLRVWGGGWYNPDYFYDYADEKGLMIWQETMFACAPYPRQDEFVANVRAEVSEQVRRISWHPSVFVWGGNNEIETSFDWYHPTQSNKPLYTADYITLFLDTIGDVMERLVPHTPYLDSSPSNGLVSKQPLIKRWGDAQDPRYGDVHFYDYYADCQNVATFPQAKFVSEHGWPSFPTWATYKEATDASDWGVGVPGMEFRQRHFNKTMEMMNQYSYHFNIPDWLTEKYNSVAQQVAAWRQYLYFNHVQQALCMDTAVGYWRRLRSSPEALTMGVLYWQLNDVWAGASWSGIDYAGRWKPMQYMLNRQFEEFVVQTHQEGGVAKVYVVSDLLLPTAGELTIKVFKMSAGPTCGPKGDEPLLIKTVPIRVPANNAYLVWNSPVKDLLVAGCTNSTCYLSVEAKVESPKGLKPGQAGYGAEQLTSSNQLFFNQFKELALSAPEVSLGSFKQVSPTVVSVELHNGPAAAPLTVLETSLVGVFSGNVLNLAPCSAQTLTFTSHQGPITADQLKQDLEAHTLYANQPPAAAVAQLMSQLVVTKKT